jgi:hypothetical protein
MRKAKQRNDDTVQLLPDSLLKKLKKHQNVNINVIKVAQNVGDKRPLGQPIRLRSQGNTFANMPRPLHTASYANPTSVVQPVFRITPQGEGQANPLYHMNRIASDDIQQPIQTRVNPADITPVKAPSIRAVQSKSAPSPYSLMDESSPDIEIPIHYVEDVPPMEGENPLANIEPKVDSMRAVPSAFWQPLDGMDGVDQDEAMEEGKQELHPLSIFPAQAAEPTQEPGRRVKPVPADLSEPSEPPGKNPKYLGERALPEGLWKSATKDRYYVLDTNTGRKVRTDAKGNPLRQ